MRVIAVVVLCGLAGSAAAEPAQTIEMAEPEAPVPQVIREDTPGPLYYRVPPDVVRPLLRSAIGVAMRSSDAAFAIDELAGVAIRFGRGADVGLWVEAGYSYSRFHEHLVPIGVGPFVRGLGPKLFDDGMVSIALVPHAVLGSLDGEFGYGIRTSAVATFWHYGLELAHQYLVVGLQRRTEIRIELTLPFTIGDGA